MNDKLAASKHQPFLIELPGGDDVARSRFRIFCDDGPPAIVHKRFVSAQEISPDEMCQKRLRISSDEFIIRIRRIRELNGIVAVLETISIPSLLFPGIMELPLAGDLYDLYRRKYDITLVNADEELRAVLLDAQQARMLQSEKGIPALQIERVARSLRQTPFEWRASLCLTACFHYGAVVQSPK
ncbi:MAG: UTRA domain-containing protein [Bryobacteraceae bacterium]|jgi:GntR family transcriptional regulator